MTGPSKDGPVRVAVLGDAMLDVSVHGVTRRVAPDAPVPVLEDCSIEMACGGAANTAANAAALGADTSLIALVGDDAAWIDLSTLLEKERVSTSGCVISGDRRTIVKRRFFASGHPLLRQDEGTHGVASQQDSRRVAASASMLRGEVDALVISDYRYGTVAPPVLEGIRSPESPRPVLVIDAKDLPAFADLRPDAVKPNYMQAVGILGLSPMSGADRVPQMADNLERLSSLCGSRLTIVSLDVDGVVYSETDDDPIHVPTVPAPMSNTSGAGDTFVAALAVSLSSGRTCGEAISHAQNASAQVVGCGGTTVFSAEEHTPADPLDGSALRRWLRSRRAAGRRIVLATGCFDVIHAGHVELFRRASALGDQLLVGINGDDSVRRLKGSTRPINTAADRAQVIGSIAGVDAVTVFHEDTPEALVELVRPDVFVKGGDYDSLSTPESALVTFFGGQTVFLPYLEGRSSSRIISGLEARR